MCVWSTVEYDVKYKDNQNIDNEGAIYTVHVEMEC